MSLNHSFQTSHAEQTKILANQLRKQTEDYVTGRFGRSNRMIFEHESALKEKLLTMASKATNAVNKSIKALVDRDDDLARMVQHEDDELDQLEIEVDEIAKEVDLLNKQLHRELANYMVERPTTITRCL